MTSQRSKDLHKFYSILDELEKSLGGSRRLSDCSSAMDWPMRGVYFVREPGERRNDGKTPRVVRVGTHAINYNQRTTLNGRLQNHTKDNGPSIFRKLVGRALIRRDGLNYPNWREKAATPEDPIERRRHLEVEHKVSCIIGKMEIVWLAIEDEASPQSRRCYIERNSIALLSNFSRTPLDPPSRNWLGTHCDPNRHPNVKKSGLWNQQHVDQAYDPRFLDQLGRFVARLGKN